MGQTIPQPTRDELSGLPVAGMVLVTDGADNAEREIDGSLDALRAAGIPVFSVGVGREQLSRDVQVTRVDLPRRVLKGTSLVVDVVITRLSLSAQSICLA